MRGIEDLRQIPPAHTLKNRSERTAEAMYKYSSEMHNQIQLNDFDQPIGNPLDHHNRCYQLAELILWDDYETVYASKLSRTEAGNLAKPFRMALGTLIIQTRFGTSDRETVRQIQENPYFQYFIGLPRFQTKAPFDPSLITLSRKRIGNVTVDQINEDVVSKNHDLVMSAKDKLTETANIPIGRAVPATQEADPLVIQPLLPIQMAQTPERRRRLRQARAANRHKKQSRQGKHQTAEL